MFWGWMLVTVIAQQGESNATEPLNCTLKMVEITNIMLYVFDYNF